MAEKFNVTEHFIGNTEWVGASWQDDEANWLVKLRETSTGEVFTHQCKILISAVGGLSNPNKCTIPGIDRFKGDIVHTAKWDPSISCRQKNVIVIGNGCISPLYYISLNSIIMWCSLLTIFIASATQVIPKIAKEAKMITQFIRVCSPISIWLSSPHADGWNRHRNTTCPARMPRPVHFGGLSSAKYQDAFSFSDFSFSFTLSHQSSSSTELGSGQKWETMRLRNAVVISQTVRRVSSWHQTQTVKVSYWLRRLNLTCDQ